MSHYNLTSKEQSLNAYQDSMEHPEKFWEEIAEENFVWRKKWEKVWDEVKYCSERCRRSN